MKKPLNKKIADLSKVPFSKIDYYCTTLEIDREVMKGLGLPFDETAAQDMQDRGMKFYFVSLTTGQYDIIKGDKFEQYLVGRSKIVPELTDQAERCRQHFIDDLVKSHSAAKPLLPVIPNKMFKNFRKN